MSNHVVSNYIYGNINIRWWFIKQKSTFSLCEENGNCGTGMFTLRRTLRYQMKRSSLKHFWVKQTPWFVNWWRISLTVLTNYASRIGIVVLLWSVIWGKMELLLRALQDRTVSKVIFQDHLQNINNRKESIVSVEMAIY